MEMGLGNLPYAMAMTFSPTKGDGWTEMIIAVLTILTFCIMLVCGQEVPEYLIGLMGLILGFYFGNQNTKYQPKTPSKAS